MVTKPKAIRKAVAVNFLSGFPATAFLAQDNAMRVPCPGWEFSVSITAWSAEFRAVKARPTGLCGSRRTGR